MTKVAILASVWLHVLVLGGLVAETEMLRVEKLPVPAAWNAAPEAIPT